MSNTRTILTTKDFMTLEVMYKRCLGCTDPLALILKKKIDSAHVVFPDDLPGDVASLNSRVAFSVNERNIDTRVLTHEHINYPVGFSLPVTTRRGLALLGLVEGQAFVVSNADGAEERIILEKVFFQPQAARRVWEAMNRPKTPAERRSALKVLPGGNCDFRYLLRSAPNDRADRGPSTA